jgi:hypothetical protein
MKAVHGDYCSTSLKEKQATFPFKIFDGNTGYFFRQKDC